MRLRLPSFPPTPPFPHLAPFSPIRGRSGPPSAARNPPTILPFFRGSLSFLKLLSQILSPFPKTGHFDRPTWHVSPLPYMKAQFFFFFPPLLGKLHRKRFQVGVFRETLPTWDLMHHPHVMFFPSSHAPDLAPSRRLPPFMNSSLTPSSFFLLRCGCFWAPFKGGSRLLAGSVKAFSSLFLFSHPDHIFPNWEHA